ncbi:MAG: urease accessory protein UreF [Hydrococcus sp. Prado102]|jgi:urease accessory protein|nr:urease accessory protein UreF [Hydrococcus sp. Prado102]
MLIAGDSSLLHLLQLASPALPVGAYSYSEGLETLVDREVINNKETLEDWIEDELKYGSIRIETAIMLRSYHSVCQNDLEALDKWNAWLSAARDTEELRQQSWQMGRSLLKLFVELQPQYSVFASAIDAPCNYAVAFGVAAACWQIEERVAAIGYLQSWTANIISAGVRLIPLGQTAGQQILINLHDLIVRVTQEILLLEDEEMSSCSWGLALASMAHQTQYTRLFRS